MALNPCRECGHRVSDAASTCPSCGAPYPTQPETTAKRRMSKERHRALTVLDVAAGVVIAAVFLSVVWWFILRLTE